MQGLRFPMPVLTLSAITRTVSSLMILDGLSVRDTLSEEAGDTAVVIHRVPHRGGHTNPSPFHTLPLPVALPTTGTSGKKDPTRRASFLFPG